MQPERIAPAEPLPPILRAKRYGDPSVFVPENLLREARRQKGLPEASVPAICVLDPDGDIVRHLRTTGQAHPNPGWACYHTVLDNFTLDGEEIGIVGCAVGASFAVLVAEELFASGCELLISVTSSGQIAPAEHAPPYFILIDKALRDEGARYHYLPPADYAYLADSLLALLGGAFASVPAPVSHGATWTTDAPFRETAHAVAHAQAVGIAAVEMEAAALYAFAAARGRAVVCFAHVTNQMGTVDNDFEKGHADGVHDALALIRAAAGRWRSQEDRHMDGPRFAVA
jgi:uridine phosphorylase